MPNGYLISITFKSGETLEFKTTKSIWVDTRNEELKVLEITPHGHEGMIPYINVKEILFIRQWETQL